MGHGRSGQRPPTLTDQRPTCFHDAQRSLCLSAALAPTRGHRPPRVETQMFLIRRSLTTLIASAVLLLGSLGFASGASAATLAATTTCSNGVDDTPGLGLICQVTIINTFTISGGSATVTVRECHGAAGDPQASCKTTTRHLTSPVTRVTQCNSAINGGGGTLRCSVKVTNHFVDVPVGATAATVSYT